MRGGVLKVPSPNESAPVGGNASKFGLANPWPPNPPSNRKLPSGNVPMATTGVAGAKTVPVLKFRFLPLARALAPALEWHSLQRPTSGSMNTVFPAAAPASVSVT
jgi:hypothetical protein